MDFFFFPILLQNNHLKGFDNEKITDYLIVITLIVAFQSCQKDEAHINEVEPSERLPEQQEAQPDISTTLASLSEINGLQQKVSASDVRKKVSWSTAKNEDKNEIWLDRERIIKTVDSVGNATYAVRFMVPDAPYNEFYNLIVADRVHGQPIAPFVQAYTIDPDYYVTYTKGDRTENGFQGTVSVYSLNAFLGDNDLSFAKLHVKNPCYKNLVFNGRGNGGVGGQTRDDRRNANGHNNQGFSSVTTTYIDRGTEKTGGVDARAWVEVGEGKWGKFGDSETTYKQMASPGKNGGWPKMEDCPWGNELLIPINELEDDHVHLEEEVKNPCVKDILKKLQRKDMQKLTVPDIGGLSGTGHLSQGILDLFDKSDNYDITFRIEEAGNNDDGIPRTASTLEQEGSNNWFITLDDDYVVKATKLSIARTIIHESVHAYIGYILKENRTSDMVTELNAINEKYKREKNNYNLTQHEFISQYVDALSVSLAVWDGRKEDVSYYKKLAWAGLESSSAYKAQKDKSGIQNAIKNEATSSKKAKGAGCY